MKNFLKAEALALVRNGEIQPSIDKYLEYLALEPNQGDDDAWSSLGGAYRRLGDIDKALEHYQRAYTLNPRSSYALVNLVSLQAARNSLADQEQLATTIPEAIRLCQDKIIETEKSIGEASEKQIFWTWYDLGTLHLISGNTVEAINIFYHAVSLTPETAKEYFRSVLGNLVFLREHNPDIPGLAEVISLLGERAN